MNNEIIANAWKYFSGRIKKSAKISKTKQRVKKTLIDYIQKIIYKKIYTILNIPIADLEFIDKNMKEFNFKISKIERIYAQLYLKGTKLGYSTEKIRKDFRKILIKAHLEGKSSFEVFKILKFTQIYK